MDIDLNDELQNSVQMTKDDNSKYLLQYILAVQGVCHENVLLLALMKLKIDQQQFDKSWSITQWLDCLKKYIEEINVKLSPLLYKLVLVNHDIGKDAVDAHIKQKFQQFILSVNHISLNDSLTSNMIDNEAMMQVASGSLSLPQSNKYYVYINTQSTNETKLATKFTTKEIEFIKWAIEQFVTQGDIIEYKPPQLTSSIIGNVNNILNDIDSNALTTEGWNHFITYSTGSTQLSQFADMSPLEVEHVLRQLCDYKWFYRTSEGKFGMDIRCIAELEEFLASTYNLSACNICKKIVQIGVTCGNIDEHFSKEYDGSDEDNDTDNDNDNSPKKMVWHVDCFKYYLAHVSHDCKGCGKSLLTGGMYIL
ncbi:similar to Saccharomyces cerevisiae YLR007W NSE1 Essential subunit of the Mms21-Smc5-Smc6 complex [Maudiozyma barnettii]|uniref:Non-structural maintenance of chromosomes element 1 homolog n=1 Tax=Maudiozyma barnettii TaxID=61262 RepID=A0A8H2VBB9_9SACH|nr:Smc5-Smc6 complex subunit NSE1 [Kazachstania barnettii]CAB4252121.1 similar to Saccharomyces cerevisiae YLR007W NSE1 Essential subunit of the Mms21-Smc5-Smc6 complex [Kazachstania barnettii]CAD1778659.1 similar to Saccharomyces cerevisiae YLR007W NSE1 Essential subunit of the Mms21-Smc5-Smc6 complex [Kazachstania barnettii]